MSRFLDIWNKSSLKEKVVAIAITKTSTPKEDALETFKTLYPTH
jgi:hypothetical protein